MPRHKKVKPRLTNQEVLDLFLAGVYTVELKTGVVYGRLGRPLYTFTGGRHEYKHSHKCPWTRIHNKGVKRSIPVHAIVWMVGTKSTPPAGWQIHHDKPPEEIEYFNCFANLFCLHPVDHTKAHNRRRNGKPHFHDNDTPF